jgi:type IV secretory pathway TrbD component
MADRPLPEHFWKVLDNAVTLGLADRDRLVRYVDSVVEGGDRQLLKALLVWGVAQEVARHQAKPDPVGSWRARVNRVAQQVIAPTVEVEVRRAGRRTIVLPGGRS